MKLARKWILVASLLLSMAVATTGTLAYLTDTDTRTNVFTMGKVDITVEEPAVGDKLTPGQQTNKDAKIVNEEGSSEAWVWMTVVVPANIKDYVTPVWTEQYKDKATETVDENGDKIYTVLVEEKLAAGAETALILDAVLMDGSIDFQNNKMVAVKDGVATEITGDLKVIVNGYAVQAEGIESVQKAYEAYNAQWGDNGGNGNNAVDVDSVEELITNLQDGNNVNAPADDTKTIFRAEEGETVEMDAKGATVTLNGVGTQAGVSNDFGYLGFVPANGEDAVVKNLNVTGSGFVEVGHHGESTGGNYTINNLKITNMTPTLKVTNNGRNIAPAFGHYGNAVMTDCVMTGVKDVEGYTSYDAAFSNNTTTTIEGGEYGKIYVYEHGKVTIKNAEVDTIDSRAMVLNGWGQLVIGAGTHVGTINLINVKSYQTTLTIEEGATVDKIIDNGVEYTQAAWVNR